MPAPSDGTRISFGAFEFDASTGELSRAGERIRLQEQPRQILAALLERPGEIVTREELRERLWKTDTFVDFEHGLNTAIKKVRQALGDSAETPQFVETLARRGYRFIAPVHDVRAALPVAEQPETTPQSRTPHFSGPKRIASLALALIVIIGAVIWLARVPAISSLLFRRAPPQLAVLPLRVLAPTGDEGAYLGIGIADAITTRLANFRQIGIRPTAAVLPFASTPPDPSRVASALRVQHLVVGTIQRIGETYRVSVQLVGADGVASWGRA